MLALLRHVRIRGFCSEPTAELKDAPVTRQRQRRRQAALALAGGWALTWLVNRSLVLVRGPSMLPTLQPGQRLLTVPASLARLRAGRVVVVRDPWADEHLVVKRLARVATDGVVVLGDHPQASTDSRVWGPLPASAVRRVAVARWPSLRRYGLRPAA